MSATDTGTHKIEIFALKGDKVVILTAQQIITDVEPSVVDQWVAKIKTDQIITGQFDGMTVIDLAAVEEIERKQTGIIVGVTYQKSEEQDYEALLMKDETTKEAFIKSVGCYLQDGYTTTTEAYSRLKASVLPLVVLAGVLAVGAFLIWFANLLMTEGGPKRAMRVKAFVFIIYWILKLIGPTGAVTLTAIAALACIVWLAARVKNPPVKIVIAKRK